ncbi:MAG: hypothetical protein ACREVO_08735 [Steroidobacteraceae bacterium]
MLLPKTLCRGLEAAFSHPFQANIYLTPPGNQGAKVHYLPGDLDDPGKLTLARRLIREGLLVTC